MIGGSSSAHDTQAIRRAAAARSHNAGPVRAAGSYIPKLNRFGRRARNIGSTDANSLPGSHHRIASGGASAPLAYLRHSRKASAKASSVVVMATTLRPGGGSA